ncbi:hypothetical protein [Pseudoduganella rhizocola]|uniref:hypothetical protein n=1 Tax=Pseudoduganella rhizocola TaxID=3382643 RepID=UPI0038B43FE8
MYILRHPGNGLAPIGIGRAPGSPVHDGKLEQLATPGTHGAVLRSAADCIVVSVTGGSVELLVSAYVAKAGDPIPALRLDQIALGTALPAPAATAAAPAAAAMPAPTPAPTAAPAAARVPIKIGPHGISIIGHVEVSGDLVAAEGSTLGDPATSRRVEGFQVMWPDKPEGVDLAYSISVENAGKSPIVQTGKFVGTRGKARRITEVTFSLVGPNAGKYQLEGMAHFSGGYDMPVITGMTLAGPSGLEHLTALRLRALPATGAVPTAWDPSPRTTVFKAPGKAPAKAKGKTRGKK